MSNEEILSAQKLCQSFRQGQQDVVVLDHVDLSIRRGQKVAIVGSSGCGKSTLLHLLAGLDRPDSGKVWVCGHSISHASESERSRLRHHYLGFVYQYHHLLSECNSLENVAMPLLLRGESLCQARSKAEALLQCVGLSSRIQSPVNELSGGERQRVAIARALVTEPACLLADEPTGNLDSHTTEQLMHWLIHTLHPSLSMSMVIVTHDMNLAQGMDQVLCLNNGVLHPQT